DMDTFLQILDLDEEDNHGFNSGMPWAYFERAAAPFGDIDNPRLSFPVSADTSLGHFLRRSSAALYGRKVQRS
ncbi:hypothetical protein JB92DRAFT_2689738, partial [Gautieria morchelliformis]